MQSPKRSDPLYEQVYEILWDKIINREILPRERLRDTDWAARLQVSRTPVREALRKLEHEGVLTALAHGGYEVRQVGRADLDGLYRCRAVLEGLAAREASPTISAGQLDDLERIIRATEPLIAEEKVAPAFRHNTEFHDCIVAASGNPHLVRLLHSLRRMILFIRSSLMREASLAGSALADYVAHLRKTQHDHRDILEALRARDADRAEALMRAHLFQTAQDMDQLLQRIETEYPDQPDDRQAL